MNNKNTYFIEGTMFIQEEKVILLSSTGSAVPWSAVPLIPGNCMVCIIILYRIFN
jgi:hypothetical protein